MALFAIVYTDGEVNIHDICKECRIKKWFPILSYIENKQIIITCFRSVDTAYQFIKRNLDKEWARGTIPLTEQQQGWMADQGWKIEILDFPKLYHNKELVPQILEFLEQPEISIGAG